MLFPGAQKSGFSSPDEDGPLEEKVAAASVLVVAPTAITLGRSPGELADRLNDPELPTPKTGIIPAFLQRFED